MEPLLIAGLGNPGDEYANTRHNAGLDFINLICSKYSLELKKENQIHGSFALYEAEDLKLIFVSPSTYMNESGLCVAQVIKFYKIPLGNVIIYHDEIDLPLGKIRVKSGGGSGGQNGIKDIDIAAGKEYTRVRIGVGHPGDKDKVSSYVLSNFAKSENIAVKKSIDFIAKNCPLLVNGENNLFMTNNNV